MKKEMVGEVPGNVLGMLADLTHKLQHGSRTPEELARFLKGENPFVVDFSALIQDWQRFYQKIFNLYFKVDFSREIDFYGAPVPEAPDEFSWFVCVPEDVTTERAFSDGKKQFPNWKDTDKSLDDVLDLSFGRDARQHPYIIRLRANIEADKDLKDLSADDIDAQKINTVTLKERLLLGRFLFWKEGLFLDKKKLTLCAGSRCTAGNVPIVDYDSGKLKVRRCHSGTRDDSLCSRRVVS